MTSSSSLVVPKSNFHSKKTCSICLNTRNNGLTMVGSKRALKWSAILRRIVRSDERVCVSHLDSHGNPTVDLDILPPSRRNTIKKRRKKHSERGRKPKTDVLMEASKQDLVDHIHSLWDEILHSTIQQSAITSSHETKSITSSTLSNGFKLI